MKCPYCENDNDRVIESRAIDDKSAIRRRRECLSCGSRFTSYERVEEKPFMVIKKDGSRQLYDRNKLLTGIRKACEKRPVSMEAIEQIADEVEKFICKEFGKEVSTQVIGEIVMEKLQRLDQVAYVRFASVYRQFESVSDFVNEIKTIK